MTLTEIAKLIERLPQETRRFSVERGPLYVSIYDPREDTYVSPDDAAAMITVACIKDLLSLGQWMGWLTREFWRAIARFDTRLWNKSATTRTPA